MSRLQSFEGLWTNLDSIVRAAHAYATRTTIHPCYQFLKVSKVFKLTGV